MILFLIIFTSVSAGIAIISALLILFVRKVLHSDMQKLAMTITALLVIQFILGMLGNLFQEIPTPSWEVFHEFGPILLHTANALFLVILSNIFLVFALKRGLCKIEALFGLLAIICAFASGIIFVNAGQNDIFSFTMALGFIAAIMTYALVAFRGTRKAKK